MKSVPFGNKLLAKFLTNYKELTSLINSRIKEKAYTLQNNYNNNFAQHHNKRGNTVMNNEEFLYNIKNKANLPYQISPPVNNLNNTSFMNNPSFSTQQQFMPYNTINYMNENHSPHTVKNNYQFSDVDYGNLMNYNVNVANRISNYPNCPSITNIQNGSHKQNPEKKKSKKKGNK